MSGAGFCNDHEHYIDAVIELKAEVDKGIDGNGSVAGLTLTTARLDARHAERPRTPWRVIVRWSK